MLRFLILLFLLFLSSCTKTVQSIKSDDIRTTAVQGEGYLLLGVNTSQDLKSIEFSGTENISLSHNDIRAGSNYILIPIKSGTYNFNKIRLSSYYRMELNEDYWTFNIKPNAINYAGHLELIRERYYFTFSLELALKNRASEAFEFVEKSFPNLQTQMPLVYAGPGEDDFFNLVNGSNYDQAE